MIEDLQKQAAETRKFLPDQWLKLDLPSQGLKKEGSLVSINLGGGDKDPDAERAASDEVFPNAQQPLSLDELGKDESFIITDEVLKLSDGNATWKPAESNFETVSDNQETDNPENPPDDEKVETIEFWFQSVGAGRKGREGRCTNRGRQIARHFANYPGRRPSLAPWHLAKRRTLFGVA